MNFNPSSLRCGFRRTSLRAKSRRPFLPYPLREGSTSRDYVPTICREVSASKQRPTHERGVTPSLSVSKKLGASLTLLIVFASVAPSFLALKYVAPYAVAHSDGG